MFQVTTPTNLTSSLHNRASIAKQTKASSKILMPTVDYKCTYCVSDSTSSNFLLHARYENIKFVSSYPALPYLVISPFPHFRFPFLIFSFLLLERPIFHGKSHDSYWAKMIIEMIYLSERKIGRGESCESTSPVKYKECASRPYLSYRNLQTSVGFVVAMVQVSYTMPTCGVS